MKVDGKGDTFIFPQGDTNVSASAKMPKGGCYFDNIIRQEKIDETNLNGKSDFEEQFQPFNEAILSYYEKTAGDIYKNTEYAIIGIYGGMGLGDAAYLPGPGNKKTPGIKIGRASCRERV